MDILDNLGQYPIYFAPGCRLLQLAPDSVAAVYDYLCRLFGTVRLNRTCCAVDDGQHHTETAVIITLCASCRRVYSTSYANLYVRDFWSVYDEYKAFFPLAQEDTVRAALTLSRHAPADTDPH